MKTACIATFLILAPAILFAAPIEGTWAATLNNEVVDLRISYDSHPQRRGSSNQGLLLPLSDLRGLTSAAANATGQTPAVFQLQREGGSIRFEGVFRGGKGSGHFRFDPARDYQSRLAASGVRFDGAGLEAKEQLLLTILGFSPTTIAELRELGYREINAEELLKIAIFDVTPQFVRELRSAGYRDLPLEEVTKLRIHKVSLDYIRDLERLGYTNLSLDELVQMRIFNITPEFIRKLADAGYRNVPREKLIRIRIHGVEDLLIEGKR